MGKARVLDGNQAATVAPRSLHLDPRGVHVRRVPRADAEPVEPTAAAALVLVYRLPELADVRD